MKANEIETNATGPVPAELPVTLTEGAARAVAARARRESMEGKPLRISVQGGGCSGATYQMDFDANAPREGDIVTTQHGVQVVIDPKSMKFLSGSTLDYKVELMSQRFVWSNPNAKSSCGCGESFGV
jgi:iron-sulfur cluster assembly accessory protein